MKFPKKLRHRGKGKVLATIYRLPDGYRLYWRARVLGVDGKLKPKSRMRLFKRYADAKREGDRMVADLAKGTSTALSPGQAADAQNAIEELQRYFQATLASAFQSGMPWASSARLGERPLSEAVDGFLSNVATVKRVELNEAVEQFVESRKLRTVAKDGRCPQLSPSWHYIVAMWLREFAKSFPGHAVCDLSREHLNAYVNGHGDLSPRTRNGRSNVVKMFLKWAVERDYLAANHRLLVADGMTKEIEDLGEVEFHTPKELRTLLESCQRAEFRSLLPVVALGGLAGLRLQEIVRLTWADVWRVPGHIEIVATKAKTRQRRLVEIVPALAAWLQPFCGCEGGVWEGTLDSFHDLFGKLRDDLGIPARRNGLRHAFCTYHFALHANENLTAQQAGNSPAMIHGHYKGLATKAEAVKWFKVRPAKTAKNIVQLPAKIVQ